MMLINLVSIWINIDSNHRIYLLVFNTYLHYTLLEVVFWYIPYNGEIVPDISKLINNKNFYINILDQIISFYNYSVLFPRFTNNNICPTHWHSDNTWCIKIPNNYTPMD